jgi:hypothetical protein
LRKRHRKQHRRGQEAGGDSQETSRVKHDEGIVIECGGGGFGGNAKTGQEACPTLTEIGVMDIIGTARKAA